MTLITYDLDPYARYSFESEVARATSSPLHSSIWYFVARVSYLVQVLTDNLFFDGNPSNHFFIRNFQN